MFHEERKCKDENYTGYLFYHDQSDDSIYEECVTNNKDICVYLQWGLFHDNSAKEHIKLAKKVKDIATKIGVDLEYSDQSQALKYTFRQFSDDV